MPSPDTTDRVYVLSRVTLGADVAVTSVLLDAAKRRYPNAEIVFVGPLKSYELFEADSRIRHRLAPYARSGALKDRLRASANLWLDDGIVIDPDSRLSQLGLISVCEEQNYFHFPSRAYGGEGSEPLAKLAAQWAHAGIRRRGSQAIRSTSALDRSTGRHHGQPRRRRKCIRSGSTMLQERELLRALADTGASILVDKGGSAEERERVERALLPGMRTHDGAFAPFAAQIATSKLFVGYDSAGGHVASACGVPLISIAKGFVSERMAARWRPDGMVLNESELAQVPDLARKILST